MLIVLVSKVTLLEWLSKFAQCWVPRESVLRGSGVHKATSTAQNLKVTLIEWHLKLTLLALHQVFTPNVIILMMKVNWKFQFLSTSLLVASRSYFFPLPLLLLPSSPPWNFFILGPHGLLGPLSHSLMQSGSGSEPFSPFFKKKLKKDGRKGWWAPN